MRRVRRVTPIGAGESARYACRVPGKVSPTLHVLREIRDELKGTNQRLDRVEARVAGVEERVGGVEGSIGSLERRHAETEVRLATELVAVARAVTEVRDLLRDRLDDRDRVDDHEQRLRAIEQRLGPNGK